MALSLACDAQPGQREAQAYVTFPVATHHRSLADKLYTAR